MREKKNFKKTCANLFRTEKHVHKNEEGVSQKKKTTTTDKPTL